MHRATALDALLSRHGVGSGVQVGGRPEKTEAVWEYREIDDSEDTTYHHESTFFAEPDPA